MEVTSRSASTWGTVLACLCGLAVSLWLISIQEPEQLEAAKNGHNDFLPFYIGGTLSGTGDLYNPKATQALQARLIGKTSDSLLYIRLPFHALLMKPLAMLPYSTAYGVFQAISFACFLTFLALCVPVWKPLAFLATVSLPVLISFRLGQDTLILLSTYAAFYVLLERRKPLLAGLVLSLCLIKFHLFVLTGLALIVRKEWKVVRGATMGSAILLTLSFAAEGLRWPADLLAMLQRPAVHGGAEIMPNLHGLTASLFHGNPAAEWVIGSLALLAFTVVATRSRDRSTVLSMGIVAGIFLSFHSYVQDTVLFLAAAAMLNSRGVKKVPRVLMALLVTPVPCFMQLLGSPWNMVQPLLLLALLMVVATQTLRSQADDVAVPAIGAVPAQSSVA